MKKIFLTLVFMIVSLCALAQPDYVGQAPADVHKYYPQYEEYFKTVFDKIKTLKPHSIALLNEEIHENMELFEEDIKSEKDKRTIILMALEMLIVGKKEFTKAKDVQGAQGDNDYKFEIAESIEDGATRRATKGREQAQNVHDRVKAKNAKLDELIGLIKCLDEQGAIRQETDKILKGLEEYFALFTDEEIKEGMEKNQGVAKLIEWYKTFSQKVGRTPSPLGQKFINEYNRIVK
jgi:hypothetical protein